MTRADWECQQLAGRLTRPVDAATGPSRDPELLSSALQDCFVPAEIAGNLVVRKEEYEAVEEEEEEEELDWQLDWLWVCPFDGLSHRHKQSRAPCIERTRASLDRT